MKVLVAGNEYSRTAFHEMLTTWGYQVSATASGTEAWEELQEKDEPVILLLDWVSELLSLLMLNQLKS